MDNCHLLRDARTFQGGLLLSTIYIIPDFALDVSYNAYWMTLLQGRRHTEQQGCKKGPLFIFIPSPPSPHLAPWLVMICHRI